MDEEQVKKSNDGIKIIVYIIKKNVANNLFDFLINPHKKNGSNENIPDLSLIRNKLHISVVKRVKKCFRAQV